MSSSLKQILSSLRSSHKARASSKKTSSNKTSSKKSESKKASPSKKFGCTFSRRSRRCRATAGSSTVDSSCRRVMKHGKRSCRLSSKARKYTRHLSARSKALLAARK